jgi:hypothetical protein
MITRCALFLLLPLAITSPSSSLAAWQADGNPVTTALVDQVQTVIVSDGSGGVLVAWADSRNYGATLHDIYCQRLSAMGVALWTGNGVALCTMPGEQLQPTIVSDGAGGAYRRVDRLPAQPRGGRNLRPARERVGYSAVDRRRSIG